MDDLGNRGPADRARIALTEPWEVRWWTRHLGVSEAQLRTAVEAVGPMARDVKAYLNR